MRRLICTFVVRIWHKTHFLMAQLICIHVLTKSTNCTNFQLNSYMPYLTLWDKISQNLVHLEANSHKIFQITQNFQTILQHILWRNKHKSHFVVFIASFLHSNKGFLVIFGELQSDFCKTLTEFYQISLKNLLYLTDFNPQLMACMVHGLQ